MSMRERIRFDNDKGSSAEGFVEMAGSVLDLAFDDWGFFLTLIFCVVAVVFAGVSALGFLFGQHVQSLRFK